MSDMTHSHALAVMAQQCRKLAALSGNKDLRSHFLDMAEEY
jgi:hypothetical protein